MGEGVNVHCGELAQGQRWADLDIGNDGIDWDSVPGLVDPTWWLHDVGPPGSAMQAASLPPNMPACRVNQKHEATSGAILRYIVNPLMPLAAPPS